MRQYAPLGIGNKRQCCYGCEERTPYCHGKNEDGTYRCKRWEEQIGVRGEEHRRRAAAAIDYNEYRYDFLKSCERKKRNHKARRL